MHGIGRARGFNAQQKLEVGPFLWRERLSRWRCRARTAVEHAAVSTGKVMAEAEGALLEIAAAQHHAGERHNVVCRVQGRAEQRHIPQLRPSSGCHRRQTKHQRAATREAEEVGPTSGPYSSVRMPRERTGRLGRVMDRRGP